MSLTTQLAPPAAAGADGAARRPRRRVLAGVLTAAAALLVFVALVVPDTLAKLKPGVFVPGAFLRIPIEGLLGAAILLAAPARRRRLVALTLGLGLGGLTALKIVNMGFLNVLGRRFNPVLDWPLFADGYNYLTETSGRTYAVAAALGSVAAVVVVLAALTLAVLRLAGAAARFPRPARRTVTALVAAWIAFALVGTQLFPGAPVASDGIASLAKQTVFMVPSALQDGREFAAEAQIDAFRDTPPSQLLAGLRGKDVVLGVVESYGRSALEDPKLAAVVVPALDAGTRKLAAAGFSARSGFLTSSTYGGGSWLAHASFQSGLWIDNEQRYRQLVSGERLTLTGAFRRAGWRTVGIEPGNSKAWPEADFYGYDEVYDSRNLGYRGPRFGWSRMPDQYTLAQFQRSVYSQPNHAPLMAEVTLTSSHTPWTAVPEMLDWDAIGDGSVYASMAGSFQQRSSLWKKRTTVRAAYAKSVVYSVDSLTSWAAKYGDDNLVMVFFGDHQAGPVVSGEGASHDVPVTIVAKDQAVLDRIAGWGWQDGLRPDPEGPVWKINTFRDEFLTAFARPAGSRH